MPATPPTRPDRHALNPPLPAFPQATSTWTAHAPALSGRSYTFRRMRGCANLCVLLALPSANAWPNKLGCNAEMEIGGRPIHGSKPAKDEWNKIIVRRDTVGGVHSKSMREGGRGGRWGWWGGTPPESFTNCSNPHRPKPHTHKDPCTGTSNPAVPRGTTFSRSCPRPRRP